MPLLIALLFTIVSYNVENLFDCRHDSRKNDYAFLPNGTYQWTPDRYWEKINNVGRVIYQCGEQRTYGTRRYDVPDLVSLIEVENDSVLTMLTTESMLESIGYQYFMTQSPDRRGIDVALLYNPETFHPITTLSIRPTLCPNQRPTRDILYVKGTTSNDRDTLHVFVVHAPSRSSGKSKTDPFRLNIVSHLLAAVDSIRQTSPESNVVITGDFNDYSSDASLQLIISHGLHEVSQTALGRNHAHTEVTGTYKFNGTWNSLDHIFISPSLLRRVGECYILDNAWLLTKDPDRGGYMPRRTFLGNDYAGGISDHLPLVMILDL